VKVSLEQWKMLSALESCGSYQAAAEELGKSQSTVSYGIKQLQEGLGVPLLEIQGRRAVLTGAGRAILRRARGLLDEAKALEAMSVDLAAGWEPEVRVAVDMIFPDELLFEALELFAPESRGSRIEIISSTLSGTQDAVLHGQAEMAVCGIIPVGYSGERLLPMNFVAVAYPEHPLFRVEGEISEKELKKHRQLVVRDSGTKRRLDSGWLGAEQRWTVSSFEQSAELVKRNLAFAFLPEHKVAKQLAAGEIKRLSLAENTKQSIFCHLVYPDKESIGPAAQLLSDKLRQVCATASKKRTLNKRFDEHF